MTKKKSVTMKKKHINGKLTIREALIGEGLIGIFLGSVLLFAAFLLQPLLGETVFLGLLLSAFVAFTFGIGRYMYFKYLSYKLNVK